MGKVFRCKDEVIYRRTDEKSEWTYGIFSHYYDYNNVEGVVVDGHFLLSTVHSILPYEGNEELVGTMDEPETEVRLEEGEWIISFGNWSDFEENDDYCLAKFIRVQEGQIYASNKIKWAYAIRFRDFDPSNMEETRKHILCVKNGKIIRYKG